MGFLDRLVDQINPFDDGKTWKQRETNTERYRRVMREQEQILREPRRKALERAKAQRDAGKLPTGQLKGKGAGFLRPEVQQQKAYELRLADILGETPQTNMQRLPNGVFVSPRSQNNLSAFSNAAATQVVYNNPLSPKAWANWYNSGREALGTWIGNEGLRDAGTRGLAERRAMESFNNAQAMDQKANFAGNAFGGVVNAGTQPLKIPQGRMGAAMLGAQAIPRYGLTSASDTGFAIREAGGSENAQKLGSAATGITSTALGTFGLGRLGQPTAGTASKAGARELIKNIAKTGNAEGLEELVEGGVDDAVARATYDPNRSIGQTAQNLATAYGTGFFSGGALGGVNVRYGGQDGGRVASQDADRAKLATQKKVNPSLNELLRTRKNVQKAYDVESNPRERKKINRYLTALDQEINKQRGYVPKVSAFVAGENAADFQKALELGKTFEGVDGKPRFEVDDSGAKLNKSKLGYQTPLSEVLDHPELYKQYPELKDYKVTKTATDTASFDPDTKQITVGAYSKNPKADLLHEIQHGIQQREGFASGGDPASFAGIKELRADNEMLKTELNAINRKLEDADDLGWSDTTIVEGRTVGELRAEKNRLEKSLKETSDQLNNYREPYENYRNLAGEAEARAVASRMNMSDGERYTKPMGKPIYHGTNEDNVITSFRDSQPNYRKGVGRGMSNQPEGIFFTEHPLVAKEYADIATQNLDYMNKAEEIRYRKGKVVKAWLDKNAKVKELPPMMSASLEAKKAVEQAKKEGYDAVRFIEKELDQYEGNPLVYEAYKELGRAPETTIVINNKLVLTDKELQSTFYDSLDVPKEDLIVRDGSGKAMSVEPEIPQKYLQEYADILRAQEDGLTGGQLVDDGEAYGYGKKRTSEHSQFYRDFYKENKKKPTKADWLEYAREQAPKDKDFMEYVRSETQQESQPKRSQLSGRQLDVPNSALKPSAEDTGNLLLETDSDIGQFTDQDASRPLDAEDFGAVAAGSKSNSTRKLIEAIKNDQELTRAAIKAEQDGQEINYYARKDSNGRSVGIEKFDPKYNSIESGFVVDKNGKILGNHIKVDETGIQVNVGGDMVNMESVLGDINKWNDTYRVTETMDRNLERMSPDKKTYRKVRNYVIGNKTKNEANFRRELSQQRRALSERAKEVQSVRNGVAKDEFNSDVFDFIEGKKTQADIKKKYGEGAKVITKYKRETRKLYDQLLDRMNTEFAKYGEQQVPRRKDYITHINELLDKPSFAGEMFGRLENSILGEGQQKTRGEIPATIAGRTENFEPRKRWNPFAQRRKGGEFTKDPFKAVDAYLEPTLYNIHMTESSVRARAIESAFRTAQQAKEDFAQIDVKEELKNAFKSNNSPVAKAFQEYANALSGKTQRWDRQIIDASEGSRKALQGWQTLQRIGGRATILGNASSVISQTLNLPSSFANAGATNFIKGMGKYLSKNDAIKQSDYVQARLTQVDSPFRSRTEKTLDGMGVPLRAVEQEVVKMTWYGHYEKAIKEGFKGKAAIAEADRLTERVTAGRGIADKPEAYRSTLANGVLQYTLEVSAQNKLFWQDLNTKQKAEYVAGAFVMNSLVGAVTGFEPLPDFIGAALDTIEDIGDDEEDDSIAQDAAQAGKRFAGELASMNPFVTAGANNFLTKDQRQAIFGENSDLGRFEGTAAPVNVIQRGVSGTRELIEGNLGNAASDLTRGFVPGGNQINKTATSAANINRGYAIDRGGNPTYPAPDTPLRMAQSLVFGQYSTPEARKYFDSEQTSVSAKDDLEKLEQSGNKAETLGQIQEARSQEKEQKASGNAPSGSVADTSDPYAVVEDAFRKSTVDGVGGQLKGLKDYDEQAIRDAVKSVNDDFKALSDELGYPIPEGYKLDTISAQEFASFKKSLDGKNILDTEKKTTSFFRDMYKSQMDDITKSFYSLGDDDMRYELEQGTISKEQMDQVIEIDNMLTSLGLQKYPQVGKTLRRELGYGLAPESGSKSKSGRRRSGGRGGRKSKYNFSDPSGFSLLKASGQSSAGSVNKLLRNAKVEYRA